MQLDCYIITLLYDHDNRYYFSLSFSLKKFTTLYVFIVMQMKLVVVVVVIVVVVVFVVVVVVVVVVSATLRPYKISPQKSCCIFLIPVLLNSLLSA